jgi:hypothetical protein
LGINQRSQIYLKTHVPNACVVAESHVYHDHQTWPVPTLGDQAHDHQLLQVVETYMHPPAKKPSPQRLDQPKSPWRGL